jgi:dihydrofolate reductase
MATDLNRPPLPFQAIAAMSLNRVIGAANRLPWRLPEDFQWFKRQTIGHVVVMGRKTFESIGRPLPDRTTIVLSRGGFAPPGVVVLPSLEAIDGAHPAVAGRQVFICGGAQVYAQALPRCTDLYLTLVKRVVEGDAFFPPFEERFEPVAVLRDERDFSITHYRRRDRLAAAG